MMLACDEQCPLLKETLELLEKDPRTLLELYADTKIPYHWLQSLASGKVKGPSVNRIYYLHQCLSNS